MKPILQHLVEMTGHRDHLRLEVSVLSTLQKLSGMVEVRALELFTDNGQFPYPPTHLGAGRPTGVSTPRPPQTRARSRWAFPELMRV